MPTLKSVLKRIEDEGGLNGVLFVEYKLYESNGRISIQLECGSNRYTGEIFLDSNHDFETLHRVKGKSVGEVLAGLEEYLTREELIPTEAIFLTDRELLEAVHRESGKITALLETVRVKQEALGELQGEYLKRSTFGESVT